MWLNILSGVSAEFRLVKQLARQGAQLIAVRENSVQAQSCYTFAEVEDGVVTHDHTVVGALTTAVKALMQMDGRRKIQ